MKYIKTITAILLVLMISLMYSDNNALKILDKYSISSIIISSENINIDDYYSQLQQAADNNNIILLNNRIAENEELNWYCIGASCDLNDKEYYTNYNDSNAKSVLPIKGDKKVKFYSFKLLSNISLSHLNFSVIGENDTSIEQFKSEIKKMGFNVEEGSSYEKIHNNLVFVLLSIGFITMYVIALMKEAKKYLLDKYNGKFVYESVLGILKYNGITILGALTVSLILVYVKLDNFELFRIQVIGLMLITLIIYLVISVLNITVCIIIRRYGTYTSLANTLPKNSLILLLVTSLSVAIVCNIYITKSGFNISNLIAKSQSIPESSLDNYYTYSLRFYGDGALGFDYMENYVDPQHVNFYKNTEEKYDGIVSCFQNCPTEYPIVNGNYLSYINRDVKLNRSKVNLLTSVKNSEVPKEVNQVITDEDKYPYVSPDTGLINVYEGPVIVINSSISEEVDSTLVSTALQRNSYFLKLTSSDMADIEKMKQDLNLEQNISDLYPVTSISSSFATEQKQKLVENFNVLILGVILLIINTVMYIYYRFKIEEKRFFLEYLHGSSRLKVMSREVLWVLLPSFVATALIFNVYTFIFTVMLVLVVIIIIALKYNRLIANVSELMKEE